MSIKNWLISAISSNPIIGSIHGHFQNLVINVLKTANLPKHVAFIMDGNRRFAKGKGLKAFEGHEAGSASLASIVEACYFLDIKYVTIYAFSIENFNRSKEEVEKLFELLVDKLNLLLEYRNDIGNLKIQVRIIGNKSLIPEETRTKLEKIEELTADNSELIFNVCFSYTSRDEIAHSISRTVGDVIENHLLVTQIDEDIIKSNFYFKADTPGVDILIRTSGHTRLSDFLIWQVNENTMIEFLNVYWPDFKVFDYYFILFKYSFNTLIESNLQNIGEKIMSGFSNDENKSIDLNSLPKPPPFVSILGETN